MLYSYGIQYLLKNKCNTFLQWKTEYQHYQGASFNGFAPMETVYPKHKKELFV